MSSCTHRPVTRALLGAAITLVSVAVPAVAQSLHGSRASVNLMYSSARESDLTFYRTASGVRSAAGDGEFVRLSESRDMTMADVSYPYVLPHTREFVKNLAVKFHSACGARLVVTSAARPRSEQPSNSSPKSVHPTGMAVDIRKPSGACLKWTRKHLLKLERAGSIEATEEFHPAHFHIAVLPEEPAPVKLAGKSGEFSKYRVRSGDTLWEIARRNDTTVKRIQAINSLHTSRIIPGQTLLVPGK